MHNMNIDSPDFFTIRISDCRLAVDEVQIRIAKHVEDKLFEIISITATERAYVVVCSTRLSVRDLDDGSEGGKFPNIW